MNVKQNIFLSSFIYRNVEILKPAGLLIAYNETKFMELTECNNNDEKVTI